NPEVQSLQKEIQEIRNTVVEHLVTIKEGLREIQQVAPSERKGGAVGGIMVGKVTRSILAKRFGRLFAVQVNYNGANGKTSFSSYPIHTIVIDSVRRNFDCKVSEKEIN
ncbi:unnamed protein product, partial [Allacma fusca]